MLLSHRVRRAGRREAPITAAAINNRYSRLSLFPITLSYLRLVGRDMSTRAQCCRALLTLIIIIIII